MIQDSQAYSKLYRHAVKTQHGVFFWKQKADFAFDELIFSWNSIRPEKGYFSFYFRLFQDEWSPWIKFAEWGRDKESLRFQRTISHQADFSVYVDTILLCPGMKATAFEMRVESLNGADMSCLHHVWASCVKRELFKAEKLDLFRKPSLQLKDFKGFSQMILKHPRFNALCSPTSTFMAVNYLCNPFISSIEDFSSYIYDHEHDIFGNWVLNAAGAYELGAQACAVHKLAGFSELYDHLNNRFPVIVSVQGELKGASKKYPEGHLMVVTGFDNNKQVVQCFDPAFSSNSEVCVEYDFREFMTAWSNRGRLCYLMLPHTPISIEPLSAHWQAKR